MNIFNRLPIESTKVEDVVVERYDPDFNNLGWQTFNVITLGIFDNPGEDHEIARLFKKIISRPHVFQPGTVYANQCGVIRALEASKRFLKKARQLQGDWFGRFNDVLGAAKRVKQQMKLLDPIIRQLTFAGVMIIDNSHIFPNRWPDTGQSKKSLPRINPGERFGSLVVVDTLTSGKVQCRCDCNNVVVKDRRHLVAGRSQSCGCRFIKRQESLNDQKRDRAWKHTGVILS